MKTKLTNNFVKYISPGPKRQIFYDNLVPSLALFITPSFINSQNLLSGGHKSFYFIYKNSSGVKKQFYIGSYPDLSPNQAREIISKQLQFQVANGKNPDLKDKIIKNNNLTINTCLDLFFEEYVSTHLKLNTYKNYYSLRKNYIESSLGGSLIDRRLVAENKRF